MKDKELQMLVDIFTGKCPTFSLTKFLFSIADNFLPQLKIRYSQIAKEIMLQLTQLKIIKISLDHRYKARNGSSQDAFL